MNDTGVVATGRLRVLRRVYLRRRYAILFYTLLLTIVAVPLVAAFELKSSLIDFFLAANLLAAVMPAGAGRGRDILLAIMTVLWLARSATAWFDHPALAAMSLGLWTLIGLLAAAAALRFVMRAKLINAEHLYAALSAYLLAGIFFGHFYWVLQQIRPGTFAVTGDFVLPAPNIEGVRKLTARGVKVRVLTNSAASTDVIAAHAGYENTREKLLKAGAELYELRPDTDMERRWSLLAGKSRAALHAKSIVFDRKSVFIGSFNLDPRSSTLNTEVGVMIDSPEIASQVAKIMDAGVSPGSAYHVTLDKDDSLVWTAENNGEKVQYDKDPGTNVWERLLFDFIGILPIDHLL